ncbi:hypothetical protein EG68_04498 [Paragonimus skrjabini miyazakii]|uniref:Uncharacterized protein n=1 Tax=Paragonimus skrjabini miyazakii TaxID=59628 RepID=A0A8S9Z3X3_9TREM|nr:hypothetical protein EG68_04498 [Paragonimus skrjabini miyazakii]
MLVRLKKYNFEIGYISGKNMVLANKPSRAPMATEEDNCTGYEPAYLTLAESDSRLPRTRQTFADDEETEKVEEQVRNGWLPLYQGLGCVDHRKRSCVPWRTFGDSSSCQKTH